MNGVVQEDFSSCTFPGPWTYQAGITRGTFCDARGRSMQDSLVTLHTGDMVRGSNSWQCERPDCLLIAWPWSWTSEKCFPSFLFPPASAQSPVNLYSGASQIQQYEWYPKCKAKKGKRWHLEELKRPRSLGLRVQEEKGSQKKGSLRHQERASLWVDLKGKNKALRPWLKQRS